MCCPLSVRYLIVCVALLILASCSSGGYNRSYIISDTHEEVVTESAEQRY